MITVPKMMKPMPTRLVPATLATSPATSIAFKVSLVWSDYPSTEGAAFPL